jgi:cation:H+ antiporter
MAWDLLWLLIGLGAIVKGGDLFVSSSVRIAEFMRMPHVVIGSTLVSLATTTPELTVSVVSGIRGESGLAVGNAVGSCICNLGLILGCVAVVREVRVHTSGLRVPYGVMLAMGGLLLAFTWDLTLQPWKGVLLVGVGLVYFAYDFLQHRRLANQVRVRHKAEVMEAVVMGANRWLETYWGTAVVFLFGALLVVAGSRFLVDAAVSLAGRLGIPALVVGLSVVAIGTSLPELVTALTSARRRVMDLALGNLLGANIANLTLIVGSAASIDEVVLTRREQLFNFPAMLGIMLLAARAATTGGKLTRVEGAMLLACYGAYLAALMLLSLGGRQA